jgi:large subunit ribosomal protein L4
MAAPKAPILDMAGKRTKDMTLEESVFAAEIKPHVVHETVRAEQNAARSGTHGVKSRGLVAGGRSKPWRQKGTGRARAGTTRAPHWKGGGAAFAPRTQFEVKVNRKTRRSALRAALSAHAANGTFGVLDASGFDSPSTRRAADLLAAWGKEAPVVVVAGSDEEHVIKSFRNLERVVVTAPGELEVSAVVWARSLLVTQRALEAVQGRAAAKPPVRAQRGPVEGARGNREVPSTESEESQA